MATARSRSPPHPKNDSAGDIVLNRQTLAGQTEDYYGVNKPEKFLFTRKAYLLKWFSSPETSLSLPPKVFFTSAKVT